MAGKVLLEVVMRPRGELTFRTPKPFGLGGYAETLTRPPEFGVAGMLRSALMDLSAFTNTPLDKNLVGEGGRTTYNFCWKLIGPYFLHGDTVYYPMPMDVFVGENGSLRLAELLMPQAELMPSSFDRRMLIAPLVDGWKQAYRERWLVSSEFMRDYLENKEELDGGKTVSTSSVLQKRRIVGVELDEGRKTVRVEQGEGRCFTVERVSLRDGWAFIAGILLDEKCEERKEVFLQLNGKIARLGGEGGMVELEVREARALLEKDILDGVRVAQDKVRLVLTSSAAFGDDVVSSFLPNVSWGEVKGCLCSKTVIGGWDYAANSPKETRLGVAPGSVYYLRAKSIPPDAVFDRSYVHANYRNVLGSSLIAKGWWKV